LGSAHVVAASKFRASSSGRFSGAADDWLVYMPFTPSPLPPPERRPEKSMTGLPAPVPAAPSLVEEEGEEAIPLRLPTPWYSCTWRLQFNSTLQQLKLMHSCTYLLGATERHAEADALDGGLQRWQ
jgi:hypothetical protein